MECDCCDGCDYLADRFAILNWFTEFLFLHSGVPIGNRIGDEGANALGDALKDTTTLTSLSLDLRGE
jgi:hypothetical protein